MIIRNPISRDDLRIKKRDRVLEIGPGHNPSFRSNVLVEKYLTDNSNRCGDVHIFPHQEIINAAGESMPFKDKEFDYVIANQVLEHADDPAQFIREMTRVSKRGYVETPSLIGEFLFPKESHKWVILYIDNKLVIYDKKKMPGNYKCDYGELFLNYLPYQSLPYKLLCYTEGDLMINRCEWQDDIDFIVNPTDDYYLSFFTKKWDRAMTEKLFPPRSFSSEICRTDKALHHIFKTKRISKSTPKAMLLEEYLKSKSHDIH
jgi:SAM-dependent methyltransferase